MGKEITASDITKIVEFIPTSVESLPCRDATNLAEIIQENGIPPTYENILELHCVTAELEATGEAQVIKNIPETKVKKMAEKIGLMASQLHTQEMLFLLADTYHNEFDEEEIQAWGKSLAVSAKLKEIESVLKAAQKYAKPASQGRSEALNTYRAREGIIRLVNYWGDFLGNPISSDIFKEKETLRYNNMEVEFNICGSATDRFVRDVLVRYNPDYLKKMREWLPRIIQEKKPKE